MRTTRLALGLALLCWAIGCSTREPLPPVAAPLTTTADAEFRQRAPAPWPAQQALGSIQTRERLLSNGLRVQIVERPNVPLVSLRYVNRAGEFAAGDVPGLASLTARAMLDGTITEDGAGVLTGIRIGGVQPEEAVGSSGTRIGFTLVSSGAAVALGALAGIVQRPAFDREALRRSAASLSNEIYDEQASLFGLAATLTARAVLGDEHPLGIEAGAYMRGLLDLDEADVRAFYTREYRPERSVLIVVGDVTAEDLWPVIERHFGGWQADPPPETRSGAVFATREIAPLEAGARGRRIYTLLAGGDQAYVLFPQRAVRTSHPDALPLQLLANVLAGGFSSRANLALRHGSGLTYGVSTRFEGAGDSSYLRILSAVEQRSVLEGIRKLEEVLTQLQMEPVSARELEDARTAYLAQFDAGTNAGVASLLADLFAAQLEVDWLRDLERRVNEIEPDDLLRVAERYLRPKGNVVVLGNYYENGDLLAKLGRVVPFYRTGR